MRRQHLCLLKEMDEGHGGGRLLGLCAFFELFRKHEAEIRKYAMGGLEFAGL